MTAIRWPESNRLYKAGFTDVRHTKQLLQKDTRYIFGTEPSQFAYYLTIAHREDGHFRVRNVPAHDHQSLFDPKYKTSPIVVLLLDCARRHSITQTGMHVSLGDSEEWERLLTHFEVSPVFVDLLHNNNGGSFAQTTYGEQNEPEAIALELGYKVGVWWRRELNIYVRTEYDTGRTVVLVMGTDPRLNADRLRAVLGANTSFSWPQVVATLFHLTHEHLEEARADVDSRTQRHESLTGYAAKNFGIEPQGTAELILDRSLYVTTGLCQQLISATEGLSLNLAAFLRHLQEYESLVGQQRHHLQNIRESCNMLIEKAKHRSYQVTSMRIRLTTQIDVIKTLIVQRDASLTLMISQATKRDSELMRGIAAVTMVFLPATFVATFFSMVFFHVDDSLDLSVQPTVWLYPAVTVPLTAVIAFWYFAWSLGWVERMRLKSFLASRSKQAME